MTFRSAKALKTPSRLPYEAGPVSPLHDRLGLFTAVQHQPRIDTQALELGLRMMMMAAHSCGATAPAGISRQ